MLLHWLERDSKLIVGKTKQIVIPILKNLATGIVVGWVSLWYITVNQVKVLIFQKHQSTNIPICYCFDWSLQRIQVEINGANRV